MSPLHFNKSRIDARNVFNSPLYVFPQSVTLYGSSMMGGSVPAGQPLEIEGASRPGLVTKNGLVLYGIDGKPVSVSVVCYLVKQIFRANESRAG